MLGGINRALRSRILRLISVVLLPALLSACDPVDRELRLVVPRQALDKGIAETISKALNQQSGLHVTLVEPRPGRSGLEELVAGKADIAIVSNNNTYMPEVNAVLPLYSSVLHILTRRELALDELGQVFAGYTVHAGPIASASRRLFEATAQAFDVLPASLEYVDEGDCPEVFAIFAPLASQLQQTVDACGDYQMFSFGTPEQLGTGSHADAIALELPALQPLIVPAEMYGDITPVPTVTLAVQNLLVARDDLAEDLVYELSGEILRLQPALAASYPGLFSQLSEDFNETSLSYSLHPGAIQFLRRDQPDFFERYSGVGELLITILVALGSFVFAIVRLYQWRRNRRIDQFFLRAVEIRRTAFQSNEVSCWQKAEIELIDLQDQAIDELLRDRLVVDQAFHIFITFSNDLLRVLKDRLAVMNRNCQ